MANTVPDTLRSLGCTRPLVVTDEFFASSPLLTSFETRLADASLDYATFSGVVPDPTTDSLDAGVEMARAAGCDSVIGFGGGSSIDSAKAIAVLAEHGGHLARFKAPAETPAGLPILAVPTTAGTGSEATRVAVVIDSQTHEKFLCMGDGLLPVAAHVDYELTLAKPYRLTADSGLDALCHAMEAYVSRKATPFTDPLALAACRSIATHLRDACERPDDRVAREAMMLASTQAGIAFSNASVTLIHGMSRPIGARYHVPHGMSNACLLPAVTEFSLAGAPQRYADVSVAMGFADASAATATATAALLDGLRALTADLRVPSLSELDISKDDFVAAAPLMAQQALASGSPAHNPIVPTHDELIGLYERVYMHA